MSKNIYVMLSRSTTLASRFIYLITKKQYTHSSLSIEDDLNDMFFLSYLSTFAITCRIIKRIVISRIL